MSTPRAGGGGGLGRDLTAAMLSPLALESFHSPHTGGGGSAPSSGAKIVKTSSFLSMGSKDVMQMITWYNSLLEDVPHESQADADILELLKQCRPCPIQLISSIMSEVCGPSSVLGLRDSATAQSLSSGVPKTQPFGQTRSSSLQVGVDETKAQAGILYKHALRRLLTHETQRLGWSDHGLLLAQEGMHRALLSLCLDCMVQAKSMLVLSFPWTLEQSRATPFDILRVIDSFLHLFPSLPTQIQDGLEDVQTMLLESYAWKAASDQPSALLDTIQLEQEMGCGWPPNLDETMQEVANGDGKSGNSAKALSLHTLHKKLTRLAADRVALLCDQLKLPKRIVDQVWTVVEHCIERDPWLLQNRHIDSIMLCSVYSICKVQSATDSSCQIKFRTVIDAYKQMLDRSVKPRHWLNVNTATKDVELAKRNSKGSVIDFYNGVFVPRMKSYVLEFKSLSEQEAAMSSVQTPMDARRLRNEACESTEGASNDWNAHATEEQEGGVLPSAPARVPLVTPLPNERQPLVPPKVTVNVTDGSSLADSDSVGGGQLRSDGASAAGGTSLRRAVYALGESPHGDLDLLNAILGQKRNVLDNDSIGASPVVVEKARRLLANGR